MRWSNRSASTKNCNGGSRPSCRERIEDGKRWDVREGILALGNEIFKESNRETLSAERSKAELNRIVGKATGRAKAGKKEFQELGVRAMNLMNTAGVTTADFTGKSRSFAGYFAAAAAGEIKAPTATVRKMSATTEGWCAKDSPALPLVAELQPLLAELCARYDRSIRFWNTTDLLRENYRSFALLQDLYGKVRQMCSDENVMMLSETKNILSEFIRHNDAPFIYEKVGNRYDRFMIDEFQDTSTREWENFLPLLGNAMAQSEQTSVLIVGDIKQSIYRWRGGDWEILHRRAARELGEASTETIHLKENFRSLPLVVEFNNRMIGKVVESDNTALNQLLAQAPPHALGERPGKSCATPCRRPIANTRRAPARKGCIRLRQYHPLRWRAAPHRTHQSSREQGVPPKRYDDSGAQRHGRHQSRLGTARLQAPEHGSPLPVRRDDAGGAHRRHGTDQFVRHRLPEAGHESCGFAEPGHLQPFLRQTLLRCGTHGRGGRLSQIAAAVPARRGVRTDRHAVRPSGATGGDRLPASRARTDHQLLRGPRSRHSPLPQMVGRTGKRPLAERRTGRNDHRNHHDTQGQGIGKRWC
ncbi:MAG: UvrD-helicase domain-containing protein [Alistipes putredinis]